MRARVDEAGRVTGAGYLDSQTFGSGHAEQPGRSGRITWAQMTDSRPVLSATASNRQSQTVVALRHRIGKDRRSTLPLLAAPLASHRCCQL